MTSTCLTLHGNRPAFSNLTLQRLNDYWRRACAAVRLQTCSPPPPPTTSRQRTRRMSDKRGIFWFDSAGALEPPTLGGKCRNLVALTRVGLPVPPGFAIPAEMFIAFLDATGIREHVKNTLNIGGTLVSEEAATQLVALISNAKVPETSARAIL